METQARLRKAGSPYWTVLSNQVSQLRVTISRWRAGTQGCVLTVRDSCSQALVMDGTAPRVSLDGEVSLGSRVALPPGYTCLWDSRGFSLRGLSWIPPPTPTRPRANGHHGAAMAASCPVHTALTSREHWRCSCSWPVPLTPQGDRWS